MLVAALLCGMKAMKEDHHDSRAQDDGAAAADVAPHGTSAGHEGAMAQKKSIVLHRPLLMDRERKPRRYKEADGGQSLGTMPMSLIGSMPLNESPTFTRLAASLGMTSGAQNQSKEKLLHSGQFEYSRRSGCRKAAGISRKLPRSYLVFWKAAGKLPKVSAGSFPAIA